jgi:hypothetical protein
MWAVTGETKWAVVLCQFKDSPAPAFTWTAGFFQDLVTSTNPSVMGVGKFWSDMSYGQMDISQSVIKGWYTVGAFSGSLKNFTDFPDAPTRFYACANEAARDFHYPDYFGILVLANIQAGQNITQPADTISTGYSMGPINSVSGYSGSWGTAIIGSQSFNPGVLGHEMGHGYGLAHSHSVIQYSNAAPLVYGDAWDLMGTDTAPPDSYTPYTQGGTHNWLYGPGFNGPVRDKLGWIPAAKQYVFSGGTVGIDIAPLGNPNVIAGPSLVKIPIHDTSANPVLYYTLEYRTADGWDVNIGEKPHDCTECGRTVLVHQIHQNGENDLVRAGNGLGARMVGAEFSDPANNVYVSILALNSGWAEVTVSDKLLPPPPTAPTQCTTSIDPCTGTVWFSCAPNPNSEVLQLLAFDGWRDVATPVGGLISFIPGQRGFQYDFKVCAVNTAAYACSNDIYVTVPPMSCSNPPSGNPVKNCGTKGNPPCSQ